MKQSRIPCTKPRRPDGTGPQVPSLAEEDRLSLAQPWGMSVALGQREESANFQREKRDHTQQGLWTLGRTGPEERTEGASHLPGASLPDLKSHGQLPCGQGPGGVKTARTCKVSRRSCLLTPVSKELLKDVLQPHENRNPGRGGGGQHGGGAGRGTAVLNTVPLVQGTTV